MGTNGTYWTSDLYVAAWLLSKGLRTGEDLLAVRHCLDKVGAKT